MGQAPLFLNVFKKKLKCFIIYATFYHINVKKQELYGEENAGWNFADVDCGRWAVCH